MATQTFKSRNEAETKAIARDLALAARSGDLITLSGYLGAGKTLFARAFIRQYLETPDLEVPSPTYLIAVEHKGLTGIIVTHMDLYRIATADELDELGLEEALELGVVLIEWPEQALQALPPDRLDLSFEITGEMTRTLDISGTDEMLGRYQRSAQIGTFLRQNWTSQLSRKPFATDASVRNYELVENNGEIRILMDAPRTPDGPPVKHGLPYSQIAHLAEEVRPFVAIAILLRDNGFCAPEIYAHDCDNGLVLLEHLGQGGITDPENQPVAARYIESGKLLAAVHAIGWPRTNKIDDNETYTIPLFDEPAMLIEVELLTDWYLGDNEFSADDNDIREYIQIWSGYCRTAQKFRSSIVLRDYHSPNIIWRREKPGLERIGLIDFQDAMIGPAVYDLVSLAQDARVAVSPKLEEQIVNHYLNLVTSGDNQFDGEQFKFEYALMGAQRASKLLGLFVRLDTRDGKPEYRKLIPGVLQYLKRNLQHPQLSRYRQWCERVIKL